jgi:hypothetical protein
VGLVAKLIARAFCAEQSINLKFGPAILDHNISPGLAISAT